MILSYNDCEEKGMRTSEGYKLPDSVMDLKMIILSFVHSNILTCYTNDFIYNDYRQSMANLKFCQLLYALLKSESFNLSFSDRLSEYPILSGFLTSPDNYTDLSMAIKTMMNNFCDKNVQKELLNNHVKAPRHGDNIIVSINLTKIILKDIVEFNLRRLIHNGTLSDDFYSERLGMRTIYDVDEPVTIELRNNADFKTRRVAVNSGYILERPFREFDEDEEEEQLDYIQDIIIELDTNEPDIDTIEDCLSNDLFVNKAPRKIKVKLNGKVQTTKYMRVMFFNLIGTYGSNNFESRMLNQSETILVVSDYLIRGFQNYEGDNMKMFKFKNPDKWRSKSVIDPSWLIFYVKDSIKVDTELWCNYLECVLVDREELNKESLTAPFGKHYGKDGVLIDNNLFSEDIERLSEYYEELERVRGVKNEDDVEDDSADKLSEVVEETKSVVKQLEERGVDRGTLDRYEKMIEKIETSTIGNELDQIRDVLDRLLKEKGFFDEIKANVDGVIKKNKSKQFIERVFELPGIFAINRPVESNLKNRSLKDSRVRCELEAISSGLTNRILSNTLSITPQKKKFLRSQIKICRVFSKVKRGNYKNKNFYLDTITMILNDADVIIDSDCDSIWDQMVENLTSYVDDDESDDESSEDEVYEQKENVGGLHYGIIE
jgi:hypothetical protein